jgi:predicted ATPase
LSLLLGHVMNTTKGWGFEEVERLYRRACVLCEEIADSTRLPEALWGLISVGYVRSEFRKTQSLAREVLELAEQRRDSVFRILGHMELGGNAFTLGDLISAAVHFQEADRLYNPSQHRSHLTAFGADMGLFSRSWETHFLWEAGYPDRALAKSEETMKLASELSHPFTNAITLAYATMLNQFCREIREVDRLAKATIAHTTEHGFPYYLAWAEVLRGWSRAAQGAGEEGIAEIRGGIEVLQRTAGVRLPYYRFLLAEACGWSGRIEEGLLILADAFAEVAKTEERWWEPELHRLQGEFLRSEALNHRAEAESCFRTAIEIARRQRAKSLELRAAVSLGRLWRDEGNRTQAYRLLADVYEWFTEGIETQDLKDARSLLEEVAI